mmetsp:Transcript_3643/g.6915  ORF Transcript_3643/g.6915 Transcript_3643/m.6915 type:complete len:239 (-) Transcript_3643:13-729(-)
MSLPISSSRSRCARYPACSMAVPSSSSAGKVEVESSTGKVEVESAACCCVCACCTLCTSLLLPTGHLSSLPVCREGLACVESKPFSLCRTVFGELRKLLLPTGLAVDRLGRPGDGKPCKMSALLVPLLLATFFKDGFRGMLSGLYNCSKLVPPCCGGCCWAGCPMRPHPKGEVWKLPAVLWSPRASGDESWMTGEASADKAGASAAEGDAAFGAEFEARSKFDFGCMPPVRTEDSSIK